MPDKTLVVSLLEAWVDCLTHGREETLVALLNGGEGQGYAAWRVRPAPEAWQQLVQAGLASQTIMF